MKVMIKRPGDHYIGKDIPNTLEALQAEVLGPIEVVTFSDRLVGIVNEEGRLTGMPLNIAGLVGPIVFCSVDGEDFADINPEQAELMLEGFNPVRQFRAEGVESYGYAR